MSCLVYGAPSKPQVQTIVELKSRAIAGPLEGARVAFGTSTQYGPPAAFDQSLMTPAKTRDVIALSFTRIFNEGPLVSLRGSPTVSPVNEFLCASLNSASVFFKPLSARNGESFALMNFLELSHAPPLLLIEMASWTPLTSAPHSNPAQQFLPNARPMTSGERITSKPGRIISRNEASVEILMHFS